MSTLPTHTPADLDDALARLSSGAWMPIGGGTDLLETIAEGLAAPAGWWTYGQFQSSKA